MSILPDDESGTLIATMSSSAPLSAIKNESSNLSFHFQKLTDPYEILTQKDASELANDTLDMAIPYWLIFSRAPASPCAPWAFQLQNKLFPKKKRSNIPGNTPGYNSRVLYCQLLCSLFR